MKQAIAGIYSNYTTSIAQQVDMEQADGFSAGPKAKKVWIRFEHI
jgi:hypothetical protein